MTKFTFQEKVLFLLILIGLLAGTVVRTHGQTNVKDSAGVFVSVKAGAGKEADRKTDKVFKAATGELLPVFQGSKGGYYVIRTSKAGKSYKMYLKIN